MLRKIVLSKKNNTKQKDTESIIYYYSMEVNFKNKQK